MATKLAGKNVVNDLTPMERSIDEKIRQVAENNRQIARAAATYERLTEPLVAENEQLIKEIKRVAVKRRLRILRRRGSILRLPHGTLTFRDGALSLDAPKNVKRIIRKLHAIGYEQGIRIKEELDRDHLVQSPPEVQAALHPLGVRVRSHRTLSLLVEGWPRARTIATWPIRDTPRSSNKD